MKPLNPIEKRRLNIFLIIGGTILTIVLAIAVVSISVLLEKRGSTPTAPTAPASKPKAANAGQCSISFTVTGTPSPSPSATPSPTPSATPSPTPSVTPSPTPSPTPPVSCNSTCTSNANCQSGLVCSGSSPGQTGFCRNPLCTGATSCLCPTPSPTPPNGCNNGCVSNSDCASGMICSSNLCRSAVCPGNANCLCGNTPTPPTGTSRPSPTPTEQLPKAGSVLGTTTMFGLGTIITILGIIGFFAL